MKVQEYLKTHSINDLTSEFGIKVKEYDDRVVLNYDQISSPKFHPICDECRALILWKHDWSVAARAFDRFYNAGESSRTADFPFNNESRFEQKVDGSIALLYWDITNNKWQVATRSCAFAEGETVLGNTFAHVFWRAIKNTNVIEYLDSYSKNREITWVFELCSPETRVVTPFSEYHVILTGARQNSDEMQEACGRYLDEIATKMDVSRPVQYSFKNLQDAINQANELPALQEGFVLVSEADPDNFFRLKVKNTKYLAIANMRANGQISPHRILTLIKMNDHEEYLQYFETDRPYFSFIESEWVAFKQRIKEIWDSCQNIESQKEFAVTILSKVKNPVESGVLFSARKTKEDPMDVVKNLDPKKVSLALNLRIKLKEKFNINFGDETDS